jgi:DTW domain-containing protein YfiP
MDHRKARCERCQLHLELCACEEMPELLTPTRVVVLLHAQELKKPSNTGQLAARVLKNSETRIRGSADRTPLNLEGLFDEEYETVLLALTPESVEIGSFQADRPLRLLVPDGTWAQASRLASKLQKKFPTLRTVKLTDTGPSFYRLRTEHDPNGMATYEAIARALGELEGHELREKMETFFRIFSDRMLYSRGKLRAEEVVGGIKKRKL